ncbi:MAG: DUF4869 domain-containing protein [Oscillospiraceae bacterium]|nr:DUF4869 domain-containing protein [Oscillospiraceae bacterium]
MLNIRIKEDTKMSTDVEAVFTRMKNGIEDTKLNRQLLKEIEKAEYCDSHSFIDRFGNKLNLMYLSTGCKAALLVAAFPDIEIDIDECGYNARDSIIRHIKNGNIIMSEPLMELSFDEEDPIDNDISVQVDGYVFTTMEELCKYFQWR